MPDRESGKPDLRGVAAERGEDLQGVTEQQPTPRRLLDLNSGVRKKRANDKNTLYRSDQNAE